MARSAVRRQVRPGKIALAVLLLAGGTALAQPQQIQTPTLPPNLNPTPGLTPDQAVNRWIADLDAADLEVRESAQAALADNRKSTLALIEGHFFDPSMTAEQKLRLHAAGYSLFSSSPRGAMGVSFLGTTPQGVLVAPTVEGFDSRRVLTFRDVIRTIDGCPISDREQFVAAIISHDPSVEIPVGLLRNGEALTVMVRLGSYSQLHNMPPMPDERSLQRAWVIRLARLAKGAAAQFPEPIDAVNTAPDLDDLEADAALVHRGPERNGDSSLLVAPTLVAGGEPRPRAGWEWSALTAGARGGMMVAQPDPAAGFRQQLEQLREERADHENRIRANRAAIEDPNTPAAVRETAMMENAIMEQQLAQLDEAIKKLEDRIARRAQHVAP